MSKCHHFFSGRSSGLLGENLLIWYAFPEDDGADTLADKSQNANDGVLGDGLGSFKPSWVNQRLDFGANNENQRVTLPSIANLDGGTSDFTVMFGVSQGTLGGNDGPYWQIGVYNTANGYLSLGISGDDTQLHHSSTVVDRADNVIEAGEKDYVFGARYTAATGEVEQFRISSAFEYSSLGTTTVSLTALDVDGGASRHMLFFAPTGHSSLADIFNGSMWSFALWASKLSDTDLAQNGRNVIQNFAPSDLDMA